MMKKTSVLFMLFFIFCFPVYATEERYELYDGEGNVIYSDVRILTAEEDMYLWKQKMKDSGLSDDLENIIDAMDATTRARIAIETMSKYNAKKSLRALKP